MGFGKVLYILYAVFLILFIVLPLFIIIYYAFTNDAGGVTLENFERFFTSSKMAGSLFYSLFLAVIITLTCFIIAFPTAYFLTKLQLGNKMILLLVVVLPMWINFTLRITALKEVLSFLEGNMAYYPFFNTIVGMTYDFLPFMIMPIYTVLLKMDKSLLEAAADLGAKKYQVFFHMILPLAKPGIASGISMVFLPAMTNYVVLELVYNSTYIMGSIIGSYFTLFDWHNGSTIAVLLFFFVLLVKLPNRQGGQEGPY